MEVDRTRSRDAGHAAVGQRRWIEGCDLLSAADAEGLLDAVGLDELADAAFAVGRHAQALHARERAHHAYLESGERGLAAAAAVKIANVFVRRGEFPLVRGWMGTTGRRQTALPTRRSRSGAGSVTPICRYWVSRSGPRCAPGRASCMSRRR